MVKAALRDCSKQIAASKIVVYRHAWICSPTRRFQDGDLVRVKPEEFTLRWRRPHLRTPGYIFGVIGTVERECVVSTAHSSRLPQLSAFVLGMSWHVIFSHLTLYVA